MESALEEDRVMGEPPVFFKQYDFSSTQWYFLDVFLLFDNHTKVSPMSPRLGDKEVFSSLKLYLDFTIAMKLVCLLKLVMHI